MMSSEQEQKQKKKGKKSYQELLDDIKKLMSKTAAVFIPELCDALRDEYPNLSNEEIKRKIICDCDGIYAYDTIRHSWPSWIIDKIAQRNRKAGWEKINKEKLNSVGKITTNLANIELPEPPVIKEPEPKYTELDDGELDKELHGLGLGTFGESNESISDLRNEILDSAADFFTALCKKDPPIGADEDLINDYIKPTREDFKSLILELSEEDRASIHNRLHYCIELAEDRLSILEKIENES